MSIEERIYNGDQAKLVLENESFEKAFADIEQELNQRWLDLPSTDETAKARDRLHLSLTMLRKVKNTLEATMMDGKLAMKELEHRRTLAERARSAISSFSSDS